MDAVRVGQKQPHIQAGRDSKPHDNPFAIGRFEGRTPKGRRALEDQEEISVMQPGLPAPSAPPMGMFGHRGPGSALPKGTSTFRIQIDSPDQRSQSMPPL